MKKENKKYFNKTIELIKNRLKIVLMAHESSIASVSRKFDVSAITVNKWKKQYFEFGYLGLINNYQKIVKFINTSEVITKEIINVIITSRIDNEWGAIRIKKRNNLNLSISSIDRILIKLKLLEKEEIIDITDNDNTSNVTKRNINRIRKNKSFTKDIDLINSNKILKLLIQPFQTIIINTKKINYLENRPKHEDEDEDLKTLPEYLITALDLKTNFVSFSYAHERSDIFSHIFIDYYSDFLKKNRIGIKETKMFHGNMDKIIDSILNQYNFNDIFNNELENEDINRKLLKRGILKDFNNIHKNFVKLSLEKEIIKDEKELLIRTYLYQLNHNNFISNKFYGNLSVRDILKKSYKKLNNDLLLMSPIISNNYLSDFISGKMAGTSIEKIELLKEDKEGVRNIIFDSLEKDLKVKSIKKGDYKNLLEINKIESILNKKLKLEKNILHDKGKILEHIGKWNDAEELFEDLMRRFARDKNNRINYINILNEFGLLKIRRSKYIESLSILKRALKISNNIKYKDGILKSNYLIASLYLQKKEISNAKLYISKAIKIADKIGNTESLCQIHTMLGNLYLEENKFDLAKNEYEEVLELSESLISDKDLILGIVFGSLNIMYSKMNKYRKALHYSIKKLDLGIKAGNNGEISLSYGSIANNYFRLKEYKKAEIYYTKQLELSAKLGYNISLFQAYTGLGAIYYELDQLDIAFNYYKNSLEYSSKLKIKNYKLLSYLNIAQISFELKQYNDSYTFFVKLFNLSKELKNSSKEKIAIKYIEKINSILTKAKDPSKKIK